MLQETYTLSNGKQIPKLGLGTWFIDDDKAAEAVREAVKAGYRLIDTAQLMVMSVVLVKEFAPVACKERNFSQYQKQLQGTKLMKTNAEVFLFMMERYNVNNRLYLS